MRASLDEQSDIIGDLVNDGDEPDDEILAIARQLVALRLVVNLTSSRPQYRSVRSRP
jgi:hypothetical protein